jgi:hypothetical protein
MGIPHLLPGCGNLQPLLPGHPSPLNRFVPDIFEGVEFVNYFLSSMSGYALTSHIQN